MDEASFGQQGTLTRVCPPKGSRPTAVKQTRYEWVYLDAAVEPFKGASVALHAPHKNTGTMSPFLAIRAEKLEEGDHAIVLMDQAGWQVSRSLEVPTGITILLLPPYSPELNPIRRLFGYLGSDYLSNSASDDYQYLLDAGAEAWRGLTPAPLRSVRDCDCVDITPEKRR
jgi:transposase